MKNSHKPIALLTVLVAVIGIAFGFKIAAASLVAVPIAFGMANLPSTDDVLRYLITWGFLDAAGGVRALLVAKTANYQILASSSAAGDKSGTIFTTRGAGGAVTFTLPAITAALAGCVYDFLGVANQTIAVAAGAGTVVTFNNAAATSVTASTAGGKIGAHMRAICDGTSWHVIGDTVGVTYTVA